jgi:uncharacterized protein YegP (UPF0339 family)
MNINFVVKAVNGQVIRASNSNSTLNQLAKTGIESSEKNFQDNSRFDRLEKRKILKS